jgi:hypothetical protein
MIELKEKFKVDHQGDQAPSPKTDANRPEANDTL